MTQDDCGTAPSGRLGPATPRARVLLTTFSKALANALRLRVRIVMGDASDIGSAIHPVTRIGYEFTGRHSINRTSRRQRGLRPWCARQPRRSSGTGSRRVSTIETFDDPEQKSEAVRDWIAGRIEHGLQPQEIGVFVRSTRKLRRARNAVKQAGVPAVELAIGSRSHRASSRSACTLRKGSKFVRSSTWCVRRRDHPVAGAHREYSR
jgi:superfamily I DNA/RNA helicase